MSWKPSTEHPWRTQKILGRNAMERNRQMLYRRQNMAHSKKDALVTGQNEKQPALPLNTVRGLLAFRGETIASWARRHGYSDAYVHLSMRGLRRGPKARRIVAELKADLGV